MSSYVYMKVLESAPERYDKGIRRISGGKIDDVYARIASRVAAPGRRILDVGTGTGNVAIACALRGAEVVGIDRSAGMLEVAREKTKELALGDRIRFMEIGAMEIEDHFAEQSCDAITMCLLFSELFPEERAYVLRIARSRLALGGSLVIADEVLPASAASRIARFVRRLPAAALSYLLTQTTTHPVEGLADALREAGFSKVHEERIGDDFAIVEGRR